MLMFALFPILGITQGFIPIAGYNHGAQNYERSRISKFLSYACCVTVLYFTMPIVSVFTTDPKLFQRHRMPCVGYLQLLYYCHPVNGAAYFQAAGNAKKALLLTLSKQGFS
jgi:Na+-driven multidrug efflux pump